MKHSLSILLIALLSACASTQQYVPLANLDTLHDGNALIHVERESGLVGSGRVVEVTENGKVVGQVTPGKSITWERPAGPVAINLAPAVLATSNNPPINLNLIAGKVYNFIASWSWGSNSFVIEQKK